MRNGRLAAIAIAALALDLIFSSVYVVHEGEQALVVRLGAPVDVVGRPGLKVKAPFIDTVYVTSTRSLLLKSPVEQAIMATRSGSRRSPMRAIASSIRCASIKLCERRRRRTRSSPRLSAPPRGGSSVRSRSARCSPMSADISSRKRSRSESRSTRCVSIAPTCRSKRARRSTTA